MLVKLTVKPPAVKLLLVRTAVDVVVTWSASDPETVEPAMARVPVVTPEPTLNMFRPFPAVIWKGPDPVKALTAMLSPPDPPLTVNGPLKEGRALSVSESPWLPRLIVRDEDGMGKVSEPTVPRPSVSCRLFP